MPGRFARVQAMFFLGEECLGRKAINPSVQTYLQSPNKPVLDYKTEEEYIDAYSDFYDEILMNKVDED